MQKAETFVGGCLLVCLVCFFAVNLHNTLKLHNRGRGETPWVEVEEPSGAVVSIAALGTFVYFAEALLYTLLALTERLSWLTAVSLPLQEPFNLFTQGLGLTLTAVGYLLFMWSVIVRGKYATSWAMRDSHELVTWGPYHHVRHPSYLAYFLMFTGLLTMWPNLLALIPLTAIPGYVKVTAKEEKLLEKRFGDEYREYQKKTRRFLPSI